MITEAIDRVLGLAKPETVEIDGTQYWTSNQKPVIPPHPAKLGFSTLTAMRDYITCMPDEHHEISLFVVVESPTKVVLYGQADPDAKHRRQFASASCETANVPGVFVCGSWSPMEEFLIKLQAQFIPNDDHARVLQILGNVTGEEARTEIDDGVTQRVATRSGVVLAEGATIENPVILAPYRTFREVVQPESPFILRVNGGEEKSAALFEADGGTWRLTAIAAIKTWLQEGLGEAVVVLG